MLQASAASWNAGDLDGFMDDYWVSDELTFSGANGVTRGWHNVKERYLQTYWAPDAVRDSLRFEDIEVQALGADHALALGRYVLYQPEGRDEPVSSGFFTLVLRQTDGEWRIVHDHTSATPDDDVRVGDGG
jgi:beta-aspartyl-peptidase (threonine type)